MLFLSVEIFIQNRPPGLLSRCCADEIMRLILSELKSRTCAPCSITVVTGRGNGSGNGGAVLTLQFHAFFTEHGGPEITEVLGNPGRFVPSRDSILRWLV